MPTRRKRGGWGLGSEENPFGDEGLRCVIRLLISIGPDISSCDARGVREADAQAHRVRFRRPPSLGGIVGLARAAQVGGAGGGPLWLDAV